jgi:DNA-directed RNA polymerase specialized sigma24 family protein
VVPARDEGFTSTTRGIAIYVDWQHRAHFFAVSAQIMRHILLDRAWRRVAAKRGGNAERVDLDELPDLSGERANELIALEDALNALAAMDARKPRVIELRFFGGLSVGGLLGTGACWGHP